MDVLCIDDDELDLMIVTRALARALPALSVGTARDLDSALRAIEIEALPRALLLDWQLGGGDSVELLEAVRALPGGASLQVVMVSGAREEVPGIKAYRALGVLGWVEKGSVGAMASALQALLRPHF